MAGASRRDGNRTGAGGDPVTGAPFVFEDKMGLSGNPSATDPTGCAQWMKSIEAQRSSGGDDFGESVDRAYDEWLFEQWREKQCQA